MYRFSQKSAVRSRSLTLISSFLIACTVGLSQPLTLPVKGPFPDVSDSVNVHYARLLKEFGKNKKMPEALEKQIIYALSYFPELVNAKIEFRLKKSKGGIIATRPTIGGLLRQSSKRKYIVIINDSIEGRRLPLFSNSDLNGQVGILGHELCHILYFNERTGLALIGLGIAHISERYIDRFEYNTDSMNIKRGLGYQLIAWNEYLYKGFRAMRPDLTTVSENFVPGKRYMSIDQIKSAMAR